MPAPPRITDRMLLSMHDAFSAVHDTHRQVEDAVRTWEERIGRQELEAEWEREQGKGATGNG